MNVNEWVAKWWRTMPPEMQADFMGVVMPHTHVAPEPGAQSESAVQGDIQLAMSREFGGPLYRNNSGAGTIPDPNNPNKSSFVRWGLGNTSDRVNKAWKSSDLIGITPVLITQAHVGARLGVFTAVEAKKPGWHLTDGDKRGQAQNNFMTAVKTFGGFAGFAQSVSDLRRIITNQRGN